MTGDNWFLLFFSIFFVVSVNIFLLLYKKIAINNGIIAKKNFRTLHKEDIPRGGGVVIALIILITIFIFFFLGKIADKQTLYLFIGAGLATLVGFLDDIFDVKALIKLSCQILLAFYAILVLTIFYSSPDYLESLSMYFYTSIGVFLLVWFMNMFNFMDGIDGLAASTTMCICWSVAYLIYLSSGLNDSSLTLFIIGLACFSFLFFNFPPASLFMGDSGSLFLGYCVGALIIKSLLLSEINIWVWLIMLSYFLGDTLSTTLYRLLKVKVWYGSHRSHAYQNLARLWDSHFYVTLSVSFFHLIWLMPLAVLSLYFDKYQLLIFLVGIAPVIVFNFFYGPRLSHK